MATMPQLTGLAGKVVVVTGAGRMRSIGRQMAIDFGAAGCNVVLTGSGRARDQYPDDEITAGWRDIESVAEDVRATGSQALPLVSDVRDADAVEDLAKQTLSVFGRVDFIINNASAARGEDRAPVTEVALAPWRNVIETNLFGPFYMCRAFGRRLVEQGEGGAIVNISSLAGKMMPPTASAYAASKAGLQALSASMAQEVGVYGIRVNTICPGYIDTTRWDLLGRGDEWEEFVRREIPLGRMGRSADISAMTLFLCSDQGAYVNGQAFNVDGGAVVEH